MSKVDNFPYPTPIPAKIWRVPYGVDPSCWVHRERGKVRLISREIIFMNSNLYDHDTSTLQTDGQTDRRMDNLPWQYRTPLGFAR